MTSQYFFPHIYHLELELTEYQGIGQYPGSQSCSQPRSTFAKRRLSFSLQRLQLQILPGAPKKGQGDNLSRSKVPLHGCCADPRPGSGHLRRAWSRRFRWPGVTAINNNYNNKTRQSKQCGFSIYTFDNLKSKSMVRLVREEKMVLSGLVFARRIARMILNQNI